MALITLNKTPFSQPLPPDLIKVGQLITFIHQNCKTPELTISDVIIDGEPWDFSHNGQVTQKLINDCQKIEFLFVETKKFLEEILSLSLAFLEASLKKIEELSTLYISNLVNLANQKFTELTETLSSFTQLISLVYQSLKDHPAAPLKEKVDQFFFPLEAHLLSTLKLLVPAQEKRDMIMIADLLEYELSDNLQKWKNNVITPLQQLLTEL